jgi:hypothetical protein
MLSDAEDERELGGGGDKQETRVSKKIVDSSLIGLSYYSMNPTSSLYSTLAYRYGLSIGNSYAAEIFAIVVWSRRVPVHRTLGGVLVMVVHTDADDGSLG